MKKPIIYLFLFFITMVLVNSCAKSPKKEFVWAAMNHNVCTTLRGKVVVYAVFANTKKTEKWTEEEVKQMKDSLEEAFDWIERKAAANDVELEFDIQYLDTMKVVLKDFPGYDPKGKKQKTNETTSDEKVTKWANACAKRLGTMLPAAKVFDDGYPHVGVPVDMERWIARLRDENETSNVLFMYLFNIPQGHRFTASANIMDNENVEFMISSFRDPSLIAFETLRIFGALPVYIGSDLGISSRRLSKLRKQYPDDVMVDPFKDLDDLEIGEFTQFLIGWKKEKKVGIEL